jgi:hypothetical protein
MRTSIVMTSKEINGAQAMQLVDYWKQVKLGKVLEDGDLAITIDYVAELKIEDEKGEKEPFTSYVFVTTDNKMYVTSSRPLYSHVIDKLVESENQPVAVTIGKRVSSRDSSRTYFILV